MKDDPIDAEIVQECTNIMRETKESLQDQAAGAVKEALERRYSHAKRIVERFTAADHERRR